LVEFGYGIIIMVDLIFVLNAFVDDLWLDGISVVLSTLSIPGLYIQCANPNTVSIDLNFSRRCEYCFWMGVGQYMSYWRW
jgi:hypothetical protein